MLQSVVELQSFLRASKALSLSEEDRIAIIDFLAEQPESGISLGAGLRKVRIARQGGGKSGGYRVIYFFGGIEIPVLLVTIFAKNDRANISSAEQNQLANICVEIASNYRSRK